MPIKLDETPIPQKGFGRAESYIPDDRNSNAAQRFYKAIKPLMYESERIDFAWKAVKQLQAASAFPWEFVKELADASMNWDFTQDVVDETGEVLREAYGTWVNFYKTELEPIVGPYAELKTTYDKYIQGEISHEEGQEEISRRAKINARDEEIKQRYADGWTQKQLENEYEISQGRISQILGNCEISQNTNTQQERSDKSGVSRRTQVKIDKIRIIDPDLADQCEAGAMKVAEAERQVGLAPTDYDKAKKLIYKLDSEQDLIELRHEIDCRLDKLNKEV